MANLPPAPLNTIQLLNIIGITNEDATDGIIDDMLTDPEGIGHLIDENAEGIHSACAGYAKRTLANGRFIVNRVQQKRMISLMYWVQDQKRIGEAPNFPGHYTQAMVRAEISASN